MICFFATFYDKFYFLYKRQFVGSIYIFVCLQRKNIPPHNPNMMPAYAPVHTMSARHFTISFFSAAQTNTPANMARAVQSRISVARYTDTPVSLSVYRSVNFHNPLYILSPSQFFKILSYTFHYLTYGYPRSKELLLL